MPSLSKRTDLIKPSPTLTLDAKVKAMKAAGEDVINMGVGEPDFSTPDNIKEAAVKAVRDGFTRYTASEGTLELREAVAAKLLRDDRLEFKPSQIVVSNGGKHSLYNAAQCLFQEGDEVVIPTPCWVTYPDQILLSGARPVFAPTKKEDGYVLTPEGLRAVLTPRTKGLIINSPCNPTGSVYGARDLEALVPVVMESDIWVVSDDIYENLLYDSSSFVNMAMVDPRVRERVVITSGVSKTYSMTGWRIGYMAGPESLAKAAAKLQSQMTSNPNSIAQKAALAALTGPGTEAEKMRRTFDDRRRLVLELLARIPLVSCPEPKGAFYVFPDFSGHYGREIEGKKIEGSGDLAALLLEKCRVATVPGLAFMADDNLRLSYAVSEVDIRRGLERIKDILAN
ncbi:MAG: pyridoxal phosphate-dependent aminotransferase [Deltaproteobacteria bacterium]|jgi:aspartate aminotransferase|nr:pyridoxal phosphate-dependent aminotransferase [Deltaproteobacteria bacterium]